MKISILKLYLSKVKRLITNKSVDEEANDKYYNFDAIGYYYNNMKHSQSGNILDDKTIADIDFYELFKSIDFTKSKVGQQFYLCKLLILDSVNDFNEQEKWINYFTKNANIRCNIENILSNLGRNEAYYLVNLFLDDYVERPKYYNIFKYLSFLPIYFFLMTFFSNLFFILLGISILINLFLHYKNKKYIYLYKDSIIQLLELIRCVNDIMKIELPDCEIDSVKSSINSIEKLKNKMYIFRLEKVGDSDFFEIFFFFIEYIKIIFLLEPLIVFDVLDSLKSKKCDVKCIYDYVGMIDSYLSILRMRENVENYCIPIISEENRTLSFTEMYHPLINNCISNDLRVNGKSILITGSNMAGKTTFIRSVAINVLLAQTINTCFAKEFIFCPMKLFSAIRISDDLLNDKSYYFEEVLTIKKMLDQSSKQIGNLFLLDEIFKGTNTIERISAGKAVLSYLTKFRNNIIFVSTHDVELAEFLKETYDVYHFTEIIQNDQINFDYKLKKGYLSTRNAIRILEINDYPDEIILDAKTTSYILENNNSCTRL